MAVRNEYTDPKIVANRIAGAVGAQGIKSFRHVATFEIAAADDDLSILRVIPSIPASVIPISLRIMCDALTGCTSCDVGLYKPDLGAVVSVALLGSALNLSAGYSRILALDGLANVDIANQYKMLWELAGQTIVNKAQAFDIALTFNTIGSGAGTVTVVSEWGSP